MYPNNAIKKTQLGADSDLDQNQTALTINLRNQKVDVAKLNPEAKSKLIDFLANRYEENTTNIQVKGHQPTDRMTSDFDDLIQLITNELNPKVMSEAGKAKLIYLLHHRVEQQDKLLGAGAKSNAKAFTGNRKPTVKEQPVQPKRTAAKAPKVVVEEDPYAAAQRQLESQPGSLKSSNKQTQPQGLLDELNAAQTAREKVAPRQPIDLTDTSNQEPMGAIEKTGLLDKLVGLIKSRKEETQDDFEFYTESSQPSAQSEGIPVYTGPEDDEDDEDDEVDNEQLFALKDHFNTHSQNQWPTEGRDMVIEVVHLNNGEVKDVTYLEKGENYSARVGSKSIVIARNKGKNKCMYHFSGEHFKGEIRQRAGGQLSVNPLMDAGGGMFSAKGAEIPQQSDVCMRNGTDTYVIRSNFPICTPKVKIEEVDRKPAYKSLAGSTGFHVFVMLVLAIFVNYQAPLEPEEPKFVKMELPKEKPPEPKKPEPPKPKPKPKPEPKPEPKKEKPKPKPEPKPKPKPKEKPKPKPQTKAEKKPVKKPVAKPKAGGGKEGNIKKRNVNQTGLLAALGTSSGKKPGPTKALAKVTSLDAVSSSSKSKLTVAGLKAKVGDSRMTLPTGELITSKGSADVLRSGGVGGKGSVAALARGGTGSKSVGAMVSVDAAASRAKIKGGLTREQVKRVIDAHMDEVTYCYETALMNSPGLAGKIVFEWKVQASGKVGEVNINSSTVKSDDIHSCIKSAIKSWPFPQPSGGEAVFVSYPFIFDQVGF